MQTLVANSGFSPIPFPMYRCATHRSWFGSDGTPGRATPDKEPLTEHGEQNARQLGQRLRRLTFVRVFTSLRQRVFRTCELAGFKAAALVDPDLMF